MTARVSSGFHSPTLCLFVPKQGVPVKSRTLNPLTKKICPKITPEIESSQNLTAL